MHVKGVVHGSLERTSRHECVLIVRLCSEARCAGRLERRPGGTDRDFGHGPLTEIAVIIAEFVADPVECFRYRSGIGDVAGVGPAVGELRRKQELRNTSGFTS